MPEGDTIFRSARTLQQALAGYKVTLFETAYAQLASVNDQSPVAGRTIEQVESRGKWLLIHFSSDLILATHMLMSGSWHIYRVGERWKRSRRHMRVVVGTADLLAVAFDVPVARFHTRRTLERFLGIAGLGPDLLGGSFAADEVSARLLEQESEEVGNVLLNQRVLAGIGNVFKSEICFACGVHPFRKIASLRPQEVDCLLATARRFLAASVAEDGEGRRTTGSIHPTARYWVYRRAGSACRRCGTTIVMRRQGVGARSSYWCPDCQKE
jgi:endonuclease VIII